MRISLVTAVLLTSLLAACASSKTPSKSVDQSGTLKIHPGLIGQPVPPELQSQEPAPAAPAANPESEPPAAPATKPGAAGNKLQQDVYFEQNSAVLKPEFAEALKAHARQLSQNPGTRIRIEGHADERGSDEYNLQLGLKRAKAVKEALLSTGVSAKRIKVATLGKSKPKRAGHDNESWAENRRAEIVYEK